MVKKIGIVGDFNSEFRPHIATNESIEHSRNATELDFEVEWLPTDFIDNNLDRVLKEYQSFWIAPGSPYKSMSGALKLIQFTRENNIPTFGTCGGFQHMAIEFARNVLNITDAEHAEYNPYASRLIVNPLSCGLKGEKLTVELLKDSSIVASIFQSDNIEEKYYCNFGLNPEYQELFNKNGFRIVGTDHLREARILELSNHKFFVATLFVPQDNSTYEKAHPLVTEFLRVSLRS